MLFFIRIISTGRVSELFTDGYFLSEVIPGQSSVRKGDAGR